MQAHVDGAAAVSLIQATKNYGPVVAVDHVDIDIRPRELFTLLGPSGSGKTTILRIIAGLIDLTSGDLHMDGEDVRNRPTHERNVGMVFQSLALFPHMSVFDNIAFPLRMRRTSRDEVGRRVRASLDTVQLPSIAERKIHELSGGQQQRVAFARALVYDPKLLLLDEPLGALDRKLREEMQLEIVRLHREIDVTIINVTHDQREALILSDRIGVMRDGRLVQVGRGEEIYHHPRTPFVADFLGNANLIEGRGVTDAFTAGVRTAAGALIEIGSLPTGLEGRPCAAVLRAEILDVVAQADPADGRAGLAGRVALRVFEGEATYFEVDVIELGARLKASTFGRQARFEVGDEVRVEWRPEDVEVIPLGG